MMKEAVVEKLKELAKAHPLEHEGALELQLGKTAKNAATERWLKLCKEYGIQDSKGGLQWSPKGLRNRVLKRIARRKGETQSDAIWSTSIEELKLDLSDTESRFFDLYWDGPANALAQWKNTARRKLVLPHDSPHTCDPTWSAIQARCAGLGFGHQILDTVEQLVHILKQFDESIELNQCHPSVPAHAPEQREKSQGDLLAYLLQIPCDWLPMSFTPRGLQLHWGKQFKSGDDKIVALKDLEKKLEKQPHHAPLIRLYYGDNETFVTSLVCRIDYKISSRLHSRAGLISYLKEQCCEWLDWPTYQDFSERWNPGPNHPPASQIIQNSSKNGVKWSELGKELGLPLAKNVRNRQSREQTIKKYIGLKEVFGRFPTQSDLRARHLKLVGDIVHHFGTFSALYKSLGIRQRRSIKCRDGMIVQSPAERDIYHLLLDELDNPSKKKWLHSIECQVTIEGFNYICDFRLNGTTIVEMEMVDSELDYEDGIKKIYAETNRKKIHDLRNANHHVITLQQEDRFKESREKTLRYLRESLSNTDKRFRKPPQSPTSNAHRPIGYWSKSAIFDALEKAVEDFRTAEGRNPGALTELKRFVDGGTRSSFYKVLTEREQNNYLIRLGLSLSGRSGVTTKNGQIAMKRSFFLGLLLLLRSTKGVVMSSRKARNIDLVNNACAVTVTDTLRNSFGISLREFAFSCDLWYYPGGVLEKPAQQKPASFKQLKEKIDLGPKFTFSQWKAIKAILGQQQFRSAYNCWIDGEGVLLEETKEALSRLFLGTGEGLPTKFEWKEAKLNNFNDLLHRYHRKYGEISTAAWMASIGVTKNSSNGRWTPPDMWPKVRHFA